MQCDVGMVFLGRRERISMEEARLELLQDENSTAILLEDHPRTDGYVEKKPW